MSTNDSTLDFDQLTADLSRVELTDRFIHFMGKKSPETNEYEYDLPIRVSTAYFTDLVRIIPRAQDSAVPDDGAAEYKVYLEDPSVMLLPELKVYYDLTLWEYTSLMMRAQANHFTLPRL